MLCFLVSLWVLSSQCVLVSKTAFNSWWFLILCGSAFLFYEADNTILICISSSLMAAASQAIVGNSPTFATWSAVAWMVAYSTISTFLCFGAIFSTSVDSDQTWNLSQQFPSNNMSSLHTLISLLSLSVKSLLFPLSLWLLFAMKGVAIMSSLVHSLTIVSSGIYLTVNLLFEGFYWIGHVEGTCALFLFSSLLHLFFLACEDHGKSVLAWSTAFSVNLCHVVLPWDPSFSFLYGLLHGLSKSFLFSCSQGSNDLGWSLLTGLLGGLPLSFVWNVKTSFAHGSLVASTFFLWALCAYLYCFLNLGYNALPSVIKSEHWNGFGQSWFTFAVLLSLVFL